MQPGLGFGALLLGLIGCGTSAVRRAAPAPLREAAAPPVPAIAPPGAVTEIEFRNVDLHVAPGVVLGIRQLRGEMRSKTTGQPVLFDDPRSFVIRIAAAEVALDTTSLAHLMNEHVFAYAGAPLRHLSFGEDGDQLVQRGILHKGIDIPFQITARVSVTPAGLLRVHPTRLRIGSLDGEGLMRAVGVHLADLLDVSRAHGVRVDGNDLLIGPEQILPPPAIDGHLTHVRVEHGALVQTFAPVGGETERLVPPDARAANYMYFRHGTLRFGKLLMVDADLQIVDLEPRDPFEFSMARYNEQLVAGYSRNEPDLGLEVFMPDLRAGG